MEMLSTVGLRREHLISPVFVSERSANEAKSMPGMPVTPVAQIVNRVQSIADTGISSIIIFGIPKDRDRTGSAAYDRNGVVQTAVRDIRAAFGRQMSIITDVCVCQYNLTGHCGLLVNGQVHNDSTLKVLSEVAVSHAQAGADIVAPSSMMDGQVGSIRSALARQGFSTRILSYSAKHFSSLYTPFRSAAFAKKGVIDKSSYQVSFANPKQTLREIETDIQEGADMVMIKPGLAYLDLVRAVKDRFDMPVAVQNVSGEYAMVKAAGKRGWIDEDEWKVLSIASMKRAGADRIISYFALELADCLPE